MGEKQRVFTVGLLPANWLPELKDGGVGVSHTTQALPQHLSQSVSTSTCFRVSGCQAAGWEARQVSVVVGWWPLLLISGLPVSASSSWGNPARGSLRQFRAANLVTAATRSPAVSGKHNRGDSRPSHGGDGLR